MKPIQITLSDKAQKKLEDYCKKNNLKQYQVINNLLEELK